MRNSFDRRIVAIDTGLAPDGICDKSSNLELIVIFIDIKSDLCQGICQYILCQYILFYAHLYG